MEDVRRAFPFLDWVDHSRWPSDDVKVFNNIPPVEVVILLGEPVRWETNLQLIIDVLLTNGRPNLIPVNSVEQIPVIAANMDLQWMAKANSPRFGHGAFLLCLEQLYKKISGRDLVYTALVGKPNEITYDYTQNLVNELACEMRLPEVERFYMIGDNPLTDIYGANLFNRSTNSLKRYVSMLVCTGIFKPHSAMLENTKNWTNFPDITADLSEMLDYQVDHGHRDIPFCAELTRPDHVVKDVKHAIQKIFELENFSPLID